MFRHLGQLALIVSAETRHTDGHDRQGDVLSDERLPVDEFPAFGEFHDLSRGKPE